MLASVLHAASHAGFTEQWLVSRATLHRSSLERLPREVIVVRAQVQTLREPPRGRESRAETRVPESIKACTPMRIAAVPIALTMALEPPQNAQRFLIARHGETNFNAEGRIQGTLDTSVLTARGVRQAEELGCYIAEEELVRIAKVWVSPMTRARQTLACIEEACGTLLPEAVVRDDLREIELHTWEGKLKSEVMDTGWARWKADPASFVMDDGARPLPALWARAVGNWAALRRDAPGCSLVVSHGALGRCMVAAALGGTMDTFRDPRFQFDNCELVEVAWAPGAATAACWRRLHRARTAWEAAEDALDSASSEAAGEAY